MWQKDGSALGVAVLEEAAEPVSAPNLLVRLEPWHRVFLGNFADLFRFRSQPPLRLLSWPATSWPDVFVPSGFPWRGFSESVFLHVAVVAGLYWLYPLLPHREVIVAPSNFQHEDVIYYSPTEYLPPLDTGTAVASKPQKGEPAFAPQPIISVPPEADNHTQTIVTPPDIKLKQDVPLPNIVAWSHTPVAVPIAATTRPTTELKIPSLTAQVVAPTPEVSQATARRAPTLQQTVAAPSPDVNLGLQRQMVRAPEASVVAPAPAIEGASRRRMGDINIGHSDVVAPAPQLPVGEQRVLAGVGSSVAHGGGPSVVAPPPSIQGLGPSGAGGGRVIALNVRPAPPGAAAPVPAGNRRGSFAATPEGKVDAAGTPDVIAASNASTPGHGQGNGDGTGSAGNASGAPPGLLVGSAPKNTVSSAAGGGGLNENKLTASITPPRAGASRKPASEVAPENATELERKVFNGKRFYSMTLNLPNLNSSGGSWVMRFAEMNENKEKGDLAGPVATQTFDPAYPLELMRRNIQGVVVLYAVIHSDGSVGEVRVLNGVNDRLDEYARTALLHWHFLPGMKNGNAVDLEAVVRIPFKPFHFKSSF
jgi:TonB family protein